MSAERFQIYELIPKIMLEVSGISKGRQNTQQDYKFRGIDDFYNALHEPLARHGMFIVPAVLERWQTDRPSKSGGILVYTSLRISHKFFAPDGSYVEAITVGEALDPGDKSSNKAMSAAMKYALIEVFAMPTEEDNDTENQSHELAEEPATLKPEPRPHPADLPSTSNRKPAQYPPPPVAEDGSVLVTVKDAKRIGNGRNSKGDWELFLVTTSEGEFKTFDGAVFRVATAAKGRRAKIWSTAKTIGGKTAEYIEQFLRVEA